MNEFYCRQCHRKFKTLAHFIRYPNNKLPRGVRCEPKVTSASKEFNAALHFTSHYFCEHAYYPTWGQFRKAVYEHLKPKQAFDASWSVPVEYQETFKRACGR